MPQPDAIQNQDVSQQQQDLGEEGNQPILSARELAMQEIDDELAGQSDFQVQGRGGDDKKDDVLPKTLADDIEKVMVKVKVDGEVIEMPLSEVTKGYQKDAVASRRLAQAAEERKFLETRKRELDEREQRLTALPSTDKDILSNDVDAQIKEATQALIDGDEEVAVAALQKILKGRYETTTPQGIDEEALVAKTTARIEQQREQEDRAKAWDEFVGTNSHFADETSRERQYGDYLFDTKYGPQIKAGSISYREALERSAEEITAVFQGQQKITENPRQQKIARKAGIDNLPVAGSRAVRSPVAVETIDDVLNEMRRTRGQPV